ncbi:hypothetical protein AZI86_16005 [Bdellovibrio bacteriovorus]|uniref:Uncharacterized protein n=1 Tax=Bdellovibrio bacteriovorus TaxID=959 RepID=A0A150WHV5_BDEBC|nr:hypothetical protein [Bdellovibrio bacteriovorus]KYG63206.1 hypothetical protein AZI86_16005 [Bdellovibrio bacteriovorus]
MKKLSLIASTLLLSSTVLAKPVIVKDWALDDTDANSCIASTVRTLNNQKYRLELTLDKSGLYPVELWIREMPGTIETRAFKFTTEVKPLKSFAFAPFKDSAGNTTFWQVPSDTAALISYLKRETRFMAFAQIPNGAAAPTTKAVDFSLRGSSAVIDALIAQCNKKQALDRSAFEQSFVPTQVASLDALKLDEEKTAQLRSIYMGALATNAQKTKLQQQLVALNTQYAKQIQELAKVTGTLDQLTQKELVTLQNQKATIQAKIASLETQIASQQAAISAKEAEIVQANANYDAAWKVLAPFETEHKRLADNVQISRNDVASSQKRLADIDAQISNTSSSISRAENEVGSLRSQINTAESELRNIRSAADNAESDYRRFDDRRERDARMREHPLLRYCYQERADVCNWQTRSIESDINNEVDNIRRRLSSNTDQARSQVNQKLDRISSLNSSLRDYQDSRIPNLRSQLSDLRSQRPSVESALSRAKTEVSNRSAALQSYDSSVGYAEKKAAVDGASAVVVKLRGEMAQLEEAKKTSIRTREQQTLALLDTDKKIAAVLTKIQETQDRSSELNQALVPYMEEKSRIENEISFTQASIEANKAAFSQIITTL